MFVLKYFYILKMQVLMLSRIISKKPEIEKYISGGASCNEKKQMMVNNKQSIIRII